MEERKLKLGVLLDSDQVPAWAYNALERVINSTYAEIALIVFNDRKEAYKSSLDEFWKNRHKIVYSIFNRIDESLNRRQPDAFASRNLQEILPDVLTLNVRTIREGEADYFEHLDVQKIREEGLDVLIKMGFGNLRGDILSASKYGMWEYHHGDYSKNGCGPPGFWEVVEGWPETGSGLHILSEDRDGSRMIYRSWSFTYPFSPARNRSYYFWASSLFLPRQIELLHRLGEKGFRTEIEKINQGFNSPSRQTYTTPPNLLALKLFAKLFAKVIQRIYQKGVYWNQWYLMFDLNDEISTSFCNFTKIFPPKGNFWADPQIIEANGHYYIFVEEYISRGGKGHISVIEMDGQGNWKGPTRVLEKDYHLSYPFVFKWEGKYFMVPESAENRTIDLYECMEFPCEWKLKLNLMDNVTAVDTTLFRHNGKWWLFTAMAENEGSFPQVELFLFFSEELLTRKWRPHPLNPIISDVKRARPAGKLFAGSGRIFRPSQDGSKYYGYGFDLNEILLLSETDYSEKRVISVRPTGGEEIEGTHTFTREGRLTIIDAFRRRLKSF